MTTAPHRKSSIGAQTPLCPGGPSNQGIAIEVHTRHGQTTGLDIILRVVVKHG